MLELRGIAIPCGGGEELLEKKLRRLLREENVSFRIVRHSVDARKKPELFDVYSVWVDPGNAKKEAYLKKRLRQYGACEAAPVKYHFPEREEGCPRLLSRPLVIGSGPAGLFCALTLAEQGYKPLLLERGRRMEERVRDVETFFETGVLQPFSNIQFGEGGAGTFSDGKLTTNVRDRFGRRERVLNEFVEAGAPEDILYENLPHIGTDRLRETIVGLREKLIRLGGEVRFGTLAKEFLIEEGRIKGVFAEEQFGEKKSCFLPAQVVVLAVGHSARDTFRCLYGHGITMSRKNFAVGFRVTHPQEMINQRQYGLSCPEEMERLRLPAASYKLTAQLPSGRGIYSFCMCPGGHIVNASSSVGELAVNGMSNYARDSLRANSAIVMTVGEKEAGSSDPLSGLAFQERLEKRAYTLAEGRIPVEAYETFEKALSGDKGEGRKEGEISVRELSKEEAAELCLKGRSAFAPLHTLLPREMAEDFVEGMRIFDGIIPGFTGPAAYVCGLESRTSSPVRIERDAAFCSSVKGLYPCGEGAGYAGGIMSAAIDGIKTAEAIGRSFNPPA